MICRFAGVASLLGKLAWRLDGLGNRGARTAGDFERAGGGTGEGANNAVTVRAGGLVWELFGGRFAPRKTRLRLDGFGNRGARTAGANLIHARVETAAGCEGRGRLFPFRRFVVLGGDCLPLRWGRFAPRKTRLRLDGFGNRRARTAGYVFCFSGVTTLGRGAWDAEVMVSFSG